MSKKKKNNNKIILICLIILIIMSVVIVCFMNKNKKEDFNLEGFDTFVEKNINSTDFLQLVSTNLELDEKVEYCIIKLMKEKNVSSVSIDEIEKYYIEIFGKEKSDLISNCLNMNEFDNYEHNQENGEYSLRDGHVSKFNNGDGVKIKFDSKEIVGNEVIANFKIISPKMTEEFLNYFVAKKNGENAERIHKIEDRLNDILDTKELTKEDVDYLLELAEEDIDNLAYTQDFEVVFEKLDDRFIIKDVKLI